MCSGRSRSSRSTATGACWCRRRSSSSPTISCAARFWPQSVYGVLAAPARGAGSSTPAGSSSRTSCSSSLVRARHTGVVGQRRADRRTGKQRGRSGRQLPQRGRRAAARLQRGVRAASSGSRSKDDALPRQCRVALSGSGELAAYLDALRSAEAAHALRDRSITRRDGTPDQRARKRHRRVRRARASWSRSAASSSTSPTRKRARGGTGAGARRGARVGAAQIGVPGEHEPRDPDADERRRRHGRPAARHRR